MCVFFVDKGNGEKVGTGVDGWMDGRRAIKGKEKSEGLVGSTR